MRTTIFDITTQVCQCSARIVTRKADFGLIVILSKSKVIHGDAALHRDVAHHDNYSNIKFVLYYLHN